MVVYIPSQTNTDSALFALNSHHIRYPDTAIIIARDFTEANFKQVISNFHLYITYPTRDKKTPNHSYSQLMKGHKVTSISGNMNSQILGFPVRTYWVTLIGTWFGENGENGIVLHCYSDRWYYSQEISQGLSQAETVGVVLDHVKSFIFAKQSSSNDH